MKPINRSKCVVCEHKQLETLEPMYISSYPVFVGCVTTDPETDLRMEMSWAICPNCGTIKTSSPVKRLFGIPQTLK
jgi:hypothetical protein